MDKVKTQVIQKLNAIVELVRHCATKALPTQDQALMQEVTLAVVSHEGLCKLFEEEGASEKVVTLINEFGHAVAQLYKSIENFKSNPIPKLAAFPSKRLDKNLLN